MTNIIRSNILYGNKVGLCGAAIHFALVDRLKSLDGWSAVNNISMDHDDIEHIVLTVSKGRKYINVLQHAVGYLDGVRYYYVQSMYADSDDYYAVIGEYFSASLDGSNHDFDACADCIIEGISTVTGDIT